MSSSTENAAPAGNPLDLEIRHALETNSFKNALIGHPFFSAVANKELTREQVGEFLGQWWHPLHYFPTFLGRLVGSVGSIERKTAISKILWQELGEGDCARAHERIYESTMTDVGFRPEQFVNVEPFAETAELVRQYEVASMSEGMGLGFLYGTEVADLAMVSGIGRAVRRVTGVSRLPWVTIHAQQEPGHVDAAITTLPHHAHVTSQDRVVLNAAEQMWALWADFFSALERRMFGVHKPTSDMVV